MIDMEHSRVNPETMVMLMGTAEASGLTPFVRVGENNPLLIRSAVESGAKDIFMPHIKNATEVRHALDTMRYPLLPRHPFRAEICRDIIKEMMGLPRSAYNMKEANR